jgi:hypothetical protein
MCQVIQLLEFKFMSVRDFNLNFLLKYCSLVVLHCTNGK